MFIGFYELILISNIKAECRSLWIVISWSGNIMVIGVLLLLPAVFSPVASSTIQTSVGAGVRLSCPMAATASQCETRACTWTGPGGVRVSGGEQDERLHVEYDRDTCECVLSIRVTSLSHAGVWR